MYEELRTYFKVEQNLFTFTWQNNSYKVVGGQTHTCLV